MVSNLNKYVNFFFYILALSFFSCQYKLYYVITQPREFYSYRQLELF